MSQSFVTRAALGSLAFGVAAAVLSASATGAFASFLLQRAEDRRLLDAAVLLATELPHATEAGDRLAQLVDEEQTETGHMAMVFAVFDASGVRLAGDGRLPFVPAGQCVAVTRDVRACGALGGPWVVVAAGAHTSSAQLVAAGLLAVLVVALGAFFFSRPLARSVVAPLARLQARLAGLDVASMTGAQLGPPAGVTEVDSLRQTLEALLARTDEALTTAGRFSANAAHELRTPLSTIQAELELLSADSAPSPEVLHRVRQTALRLSGLLERLLVLATPGDDDSPTELVSLRDVVEDTLDTLSTEDRARVSLEVAGELSVHGDAALLSMMVSNALTNGLKFGRHVTVRLTADALGFDDDGPGVPMSERARVFEPFHRRRGGAADDSSRQAAVTCWISRTSAASLRAACFQNGARLGRGHQRRKLRGQKRLAPTRPRRPSRFQLSSSF
jgi:two-component system, OmpR family, sensor kinase